MLPAWLLDDPRVVHTERTPGVAAITAEWPAWVPGDVVARLAGLGIEKPWRHQVEAAEALRQKRHVAVATGTASGKTLSYLLPILSPAGVVAEVPVNRPAKRRASRLKLVPPLPGQLPLPGLEDPAVGLLRERPVLVQSDRRRLLTGSRDTALYIAPTKALAHDQLRASRAIGPDDWRITTLDGDSDDEERRYAREFATYVLTNPDMLHRSVLPNHARWRSFLAGLRYVVVDESHRYRGVFGAHVALVLRRLRRLCAEYGAEPAFVFVSATAADATESASLLIGEDALAITPVTWDASPRGERTTLLWQPEAAAEDETAELLARLVDDGLQTLAFVPSRRAAETVSKRSSEMARTGSVAAYRSGYLARDRRAIEQGLQAGSVRGVATTNALELGVDIAGVDAVVINGFPGSVASFRQQSGRAGRRGADAVTVLVGRNDPLDAYLFDHPELIFAEPVEATVLDPANPSVLGPHLGAAAQEKPLTDDDERWFGPSLHAVVHRLTEHGTLRRRATGWFWCHRQRAVDAIDLRSTAGQPIEIIERATGRVVGTTDAARAHHTVHEGAVYLHQGEHWVVEELDEGQAEAFVRAEQPTYVTQPLSSTSVTVLSDQTRRQVGRGEVHRGAVEITTQVTGYLVRDERTGDVIDRRELDLPARTLRTLATWFTLPDEVTDGMGKLARTGGAHAVEHALHGLLPTFARNDRTDVSAASFAAHPDTGGLTVFVHDAYPGGAGFAAAGYVHAEAWVDAALSRLESCGCSAGCPRCCISPSCATGNDAVDKTAGADLLRALAG